MNMPEQLRDLEHLAKSVLWTTVNVHLPSEEYMSVLIDFAGRAADENDIEWEDELLTECVRRCMMRLCDIDYGQEY